MTVVANQFSFDIVSEVDLKEVRNAVDQAAREISQRFDFKGTGTSVTLEGDKIEVHAGTEDRLKAAWQVLQEKAVRREVPLKSLQPGEMQQAAKGTVRQSVAIIQGIPDDKAKQISKFVRNTVPKAQTQIQGSQRGSRPSRRTTSSRRSAPSRRRTSASPSSSRTTAETGAAAHVLYCSGNCPPVDSLDPLEVTMDLERLTARAEEIAERETADLLAKTTASKALYERAVKSLPNGVASNFQVGDPCPVYLEKGKGSSVWDVDGTEYKDFHGGFGVNIVGHAHPKIVEALEKAAREAIHFAVTTPTTVELAEAICERFELEQVRIVNSGTEATMDALRVARAATGRDKVVKMEGRTTATTTRCCSPWSPKRTCWGSGTTSTTRARSGTRRSRPQGDPRALWDTTIVVPFNDAGAVEQALVDNEGEVAAVILEPVMMNVGIIEPQPGYLQALRDV